MTSLLMLSSDNGKKIMAFPAMRRVFVVYLHGPINADQCIKIDPGIQSSSESPTVLSDFHKRLI